jgi:hypothetical protein
MQGFRSKKISAEIKMFFFFLNNPLMSFIFKLLKMLNSASKCLKITLKVINPLNPAGRFCSF